MTENEAGRSERPAITRRDARSLPHTAGDVAYRLWPTTRPDPVSYAKRQVVPTIAAADYALRTAIELRARIDQVLFSDLVRLHIRPTYTETLGALFVANLNVSIDRFTDALDLMEAARMETMRREYDRRLMERGRRA